MHKWVHKFIFLNQIGPFADLGNTSGSKYSPTKIKWIDKTVQKTNGDKENQTYRKLAEVIPDNDDDYIGREKVTIHQNITQSQLTPIIKVNRLIWIN